MRQISGEGTDVLKDLPMLVQCTSAFANIARQRLAGRVQIFGQVSVSDDFGVP